MKRWIALIFVSLLSLCFTAAQQEPTKTEVKQSPDGPTSVYPKIYEIRSQKAEEIFRLIEGFYPGARMSVNAAFNTLTASVNQSQHAVIADLIQKYDVPSKVVEFQFY